MIMLHNQVQILIYESKLVKGFQSYFGAEMYQTIVQWAKQEWS